jgi:anti-anti-sigma regulatory factor
MPTRDVTVNVSASRQQRGKWSGFAFLIFIKSSAVVHNCQLAFARVRASRAALFRFVRTLFHSQSFAKDAIMTIATASSFYVEQVRNVTVLCFTVRVLNEQNYDIVSEELLEFVSLVVSERPIQVVVELSSINDIDDMGLAMLQAFQDSIDDADGTLVLCRAPANVLTKIRQAALGCHCCRTRGEAVWSF